MCICPEYGHAFINTYSATCRYCQYTVNADTISYDKGFANFPELQEPPQNSMCRKGDIKQFPY